jgi:hypothetical protein
MADEPEKPATRDDQRDSSVGLVLSLAVELKRRRGVFTDRWEARITALGIILVTAVVVIFAVMQIFDLLRRIFSGS